jgi:anaerobic selenocysteine-containing dehydrogenase
VAHDLFLTESSSRADVVLPAATPYERDGSIPNWEGRAQPVRAAVPPPGLARTDAEILAALATGLGRRFPSTLAALRAEMSSLAVVSEEPRAIQVPHLTPVEPGAGLRLAVLPLLLDGGTMMAGSDALAQTAEPPFVEMSQADAGRLGLAPGSGLRVTSARGSVRAPLRVSRDVAPGSVIVPARQGDVRAAALLDADDPAPAVTVEVG